MSSLVTNFTLVTHVYRPPTLPCPALPYRALTLPYPTLPWPVLRSHSLRYRTLPYLIPPYSTLPFTTVSYRSLPFPTLPYPTLHYAALILLYSTLTLTLPLTYPTLAHKLTPPLPRNNDDQMERRVEDVRVCHRRLRGVAHH